MQNNKKTNRGCPINPMTSKLCMAFIAGLVFVLPAPLVSEEAVAQSDGTRGWTNDGIHTLHLSPSLQASDGTPLAIDDSNVAPLNRRVYQFRLQPGTLGLGGEHAPRPIQAITLREEGYQVDLDFWIREAAPRLAPMTKSTARLGLRVSPEGTRLARIFPLVLRPSGSRINVPGRLGRRDYFTDQERRITYLIFFDRACRIQGALDLGGDSLTADVEVPGPGLHALVVVEGEGGKRLVLAPPSLRALHVVTVLRECLSCPPGQ